jgi:hypothetical protein
VEASDRSWKWSGKAELQKSLRVSEYGIGLSPNESNPENAVKDLVSFPPVLASDGATGPSAISGL